MRSTRIVEMLEVTEAAALAAGRWMGKGDKHAADDAAVEGMRAAFNDVEIDGTIVIGEGERDEAPMLFIGEKVGKGGEKIDIAVDPLEGTNLTADGQSNSLAVLAFGPAGTLLHAPDTYMKKIAVGPEAAHVVHIDASPTENIINVAKAMDRDVEDLVVCILQRERHVDLIAEVRAAGARIRLITDGDVFGAVATAIEGTGIHLYLGTGAAPEGVLACAAMKCIGGCFMGRFEWRSAEEKARAVDMGTCNIDEVLTMDCLVNTDEAAFIATGVTDGEMLRGVKYFGSGARTNSVAMDAKSRTVRFIETIYNTGSREVLGADGLVPPHRALPAQERRTPANPAGPAPPKAARTTPKAPHLSGPLVCGESANGIHGRCRSALATRLPRRRDSRRTRFHHSRQLGTRSRLWVRPARDRPAWPGSPYCGNRCP